MNRGFTFAVIADTHIRPEPLDAQSAYPSDRVHNDRNRRVVEMLIKRRPELVIHLGDVTHTLPCLPSHRAAIEFAKSLFAPLPCPMYVAPGNHDVGDKMDSQATAPRVDQHSHEAFEAVWGPSWRLIDHEGCRFVLLDGCLLGSGLAREADMRAFFAESLAGSRRALVFLHYPPFVCDRGEISHYDNLALEPRHWLLDLAARHCVDAIFAGHAHTFFYNRVGPTELYCLPSTAFTRPEYAELFPVEPPAENGRDDADKLGFFLVHVQHEGHQIEMVRSGWEAAKGTGTFSALEGPKMSQSPPAFDAAPHEILLGVWLRGGVGCRVELPHGDLDEFTRKTARNDQPLLILWEMGIRSVRIPLGDLMDPATAARLAEIGPRFPPILAASVGLPRADQRAAVEHWAPRLVGWEIILAEHQLPELHACLDNCSVPVALSLLPDEKPDELGYFSHFPRPGFTDDSPLLDRLPPRDCPDFRGNENGTVPFPPSPLPVCVRWLVFRVTADSPIFADAHQGDCPDFHSAAVKMGLSPSDAPIERILGQTARRGLGAICHVELPRGTEAIPQVDDLAVLDLVKKALALASKHPDIQFYLDTLEDKDRGYYPRHGLVDRRWNPRPAAHELMRHCRREQ
jgi:predicted phosphodiesterase